jgi:hypothetical protein
MINIKGLDKAEVLYSLWHNSHAQGMSFLGLPKKEFTLERAQELIKETGYVLEGEYRPGCLYFDYVDGHVIKCDITNDEFDERLYDRDCGEGAAAKAIEYVREGKLNEIDVVSAEFEILGELIKSLSEKNKK